MNCIAGSRHAHWSQALRAAGVRCTVPVPIPSDLATFKIPMHFASCFRTFFGLDDPRGRSPLVLDARRRKPPPVSADIAKKIGLSGTILPSLPTSPHKAESCGGSHHLYFPACSPFGRSAVNGDREGAVAVSAVGRSLSSKSTLRDKLNLNGHGRSSISNGALDAHHDADHRSGFCPARPGKCAPGGPSQSSAAEQSPGRATHRPAIPRPAAPTRPAVLLE